MVDGMKIVSAVFKSAQSGIRDYPQSDEIVPKERQLPESRHWIFQPASVSAVELDVQKAEIS
jgi:hypothetical protein